MKARIKNKIVLFLQIVFTACFVILNSGCGLDEYYVLEGPGAIVCPVYSASNPLVAENKYVEFTTNSSDSSSGAFTIDGTDVYYKIYSSISTCTSEYSALNTLLNNSSTKSSSASSLINTYKFQKLKNTANSDDVFVSHDGLAVKVRIRLTQYLQDQSVDEYKALIYIGGIKSGVPIRYYGNRYFDFYRNNGTSFNAPLPRSTDYEEDVSSNTSTDSTDTTGYWYINLYAVTRGHDSSFTTYYSPICHLGTLYIDPSSYYN